MKTVLFAALLAIVPVSASAQTAILCTAANASETYIINDATKRIMFFNRKARTIDPFCLGKCRWAHTPNSIAFETDDGFITGATLDRSKGTMTLKLADDQYVKRRCTKTAMPVVAKNRF